MEFLSSFRFESETPLKNQWMVVKDQVGKNID
jgi:hypothetical protein